MLQPPVNPFYIAKKENLRVNAVKFPLEHKFISGFINYKEKAIYINTLEKFLPRRIFTIAHELGHYFLHRNDIKSYRISMRDTSKQGVSMEETQANIFAGNLLVPKFMLDRFENFSVYDLSVLFAVSKEVINIRLDQEYGK